MAITVGDNSYATAAEADAYAALRPLWAAWAIATAEAKEAALIDAARYMDRSYCWKGSISLLTQALAWPRDNVIDDEGRRITGVPPIVLDAQIEIANMALTGSLVTAATSGEVKSIKAGSVGIVFRDGQTASEISRFAPIDRLLAGLFETRAGAQVLNVPLLKA